MSFGSRFVTATLGRAIAVEPVSWSGCHRAVIALLSGVMLCGIGLRAAAGWTHTAQASPTGSLALRMSTDASSQLPAPAPNSTAFTRVVVGVGLYVTRLMRGALWAVVVLVPLETALAVSDGGGAGAIGVGVGLALCAAVGLRTSDELLPWMRVHPWSFVVVAGLVAVFLVALEQGPLAGYFGSLVYFPIALAALAGLPGFAAGSAALLTGSEVWLAAMEADESLAELVVDPRWLLNAALPLMLSLGLSVPVWFLVRFMGALPQTLVEVEGEVEDPPAPLELPAGAEPWDVLSPAEQRVVVRLPDQTPKQIAATLGLSLATVRTHLQHAKRATGTRSQAGLASWAAQHRPGGDS